MSEESSARPGHPTASPAPAPETLRIVGIGAGPGALTSLRSLFRMVPGDTELAFVVVQHPCDSDTSSALPRLVDREASMPVVLVDTPVAVKPDHVYIARDTLTLTDVDEGLKLTPCVCDPTGHTSPIDDLFRDMADRLGPAAIAVLLSSTEGAGHSGLQAVRAAGGDTFAERDALRPEEQPGCEARERVADVVTSAADIAARLTRLARRSLELGALSSASANEDLEELATVLHAATGLDLRCYKQSTLDRRIARRMRARGAATLGEYLELARSEPEEVAALHREVLIPVTHFFRDAEVFSVLAETVFPEVLEKVDPARRIRLWVPGCSTGEEAYSLMMTAIECAERAGGPREAIVYGTDVSAAALARAEEGRYPPSIEADVSPERLARFFERDECGYRVGRELRESCRFARHDITSDAALTNMHLVSMRNLLIYLRTHSQRSALAAAYDSLEPGGFLVLGTAETTGVVDGLFEVVDSSRRVYQRGG